LVRNLTIFPSLCDTWWKWAAIGVPLNLLDKRQPQGDIDLLIAMTVPIVKNNEVDLSHVIYRSFEVKTSKVKETGEIRSLKNTDKKFDKVIGQLNKLKIFGAEQIFLLEVYIAEAGFSSTSFDIPEQLVNVVKNRYKKIEGNIYGYVVTFLEQIIGFDEENTGKAHIPMNIHPPTTLSIKDPFFNLVSYLNSYFEKNNQNLEGTGKFVTVMTYCDKCKKIIIPDSYINPSCIICGKDLING